MNNEIEKAFLINLDDKTHRYEKFNEIGDPRLERFPAIDSRSDFNIYKKFGLDLNLMGLASEFYFSQAPGAIGIYLSHYLIWKKMIEENIEICMILEDDAETKDVSNYLSKNYSFNVERYDFFQLGKRCSRKRRLYSKDFDGLEAYVITKRGAEILVNTTLDNSHFKGIVEVKPFGRFKGGVPEEFKIFKKENKQLWDKKNSITCAVDKFVGYCSNPKIDESKRLRIKIDPFVDLHIQEVSSDVMDTKITPWWDSNEKELIHYMRSTKFKFWERCAKTTVCICTFDRHEILYECLLALTKQNIDKKHFNVFVLDNSEEEVKSPKMLDECISLSSLHGFEYIQKPAKGLADARNICIESTSTPIVQYIDDDSICHENFIEEVLKTFSENPDLLVVGGKTIPDWRLVDRPKWLSNKSLALLSMLDFGPDIIHRNQKKCKIENMGVPGGFYLVGANIAYHRNVFNKHGLFDIEYGRSATSSTLMGGEETEMLRRIPRKNDSRIIWSPHIKVNHLVLPERAQESWFLKRAAWQAVENVKMSMFWMENNLDKETKNHIKDHLSKILLDSENETDFQNRVDTVLYLFFHILYKGEPNLKGK